MKKLFTAILAALGIGMGACAQNLYEDVDVNRFEQIIKSDSVQFGWMFVNLMSFTEGAYSRCNTYLMC